MNRFKAAITAFINPEFISCKFVSDIRIVSESSPDCFDVAIDGWLNSGDKVSIAGKTYIVENQFIRIKE